MAIPIDNLRTTEAAANLLRNADQSTNHPDGLTSIEELKAYIARNPDLARAVGVDVDKLCALITAEEGRIASIGNLTPQREHELAAMAALYIEKGNYDWRIFDELRTNHAYAAGEVDVLESAVRYDGGDFSNTLMPMASDGIITDDERRQIDASSQDPVVRATRQVTAETRAIVARRLIGSLAIDNVVGLDPKRVGLDPPSIDVKTAARSIVNRSNAALTTILEDSHYGSAAWNKIAPGCLKGGFRSACLGNEQLDPDAIATKILAVWSTKTGPNAVSGERLLLQLMNGNNEHAPRELRAAVAKAITAKITPEQAKTMTAATATALVSGYGESVLRNVSITPEERDVFPYTMRPVPGTAASGYQYDDYNTNENLGRIMELTRDHLDWNTKTGFVSDR